MKNLLRYSEKLKHLPRTGWVKKGVTMPETVAAHSWQMALMALRLSGTIDTSYDYDKVIKLCLCHDLAESVIGDLTPEDKTYIGKEKWEQKAVECIAEESDFPELIHLFAEYTEQKTPESLLAHDLDKLDMYAQSLYYEKEYPEKDLREFRVHAEKKIITPLGRAMLEELKA